MAKPKCKVCDGDGEYEIYAANGSYWGEIECPACDGDGFDEDADGLSLGDGGLSPTEYPPSTAAGIQTIDQLRAWQAKERQETARA